MVWTDQETGKDLMKISQNLYTMITELDNVLSGGCSSLLTPLKFISKEQPITHWFTLTQTDLKLTAEEYPPQFP